MDFFRLRSPAGAVWPRIPTAEVSQVWAAYQELDRTQWLSPVELEERQLEQLRALLAHCWQQVPYYRRVMGAVGLTERPIESLSDFRRLPLLTRELYQSNFTDLQAVELPTGITAVGGSFTSGTNGVPIKVRKTNRDALWWSAFYLRDLEWSGFDPRGHLAAIRLITISRDELPRALEGITLPQWAPFFAHLLECGPLSGMDIRQDPRRQLAWLRKIDPDYLLSFPSNLSYLAGLVQESGQRLEQLRAIQAIGEPLSCDVRERVESAFGVPVKNLYSSTETGYIASPCPMGGGLHVHAENLLAEVVDADNRLCRPGETGRLVVTSLHNFITPFLRYDILDDVTLADAPCRCGRGLPLWTHVEGRQAPLLHLPDNRRKSVLGLILEIRKVGGLHQFQIVQRAVDHVVLRVVPDSTWGPERADRLRQAVHGEFESAIHVTIEPQEFLERPAGGKLKLAVIEIE